jgi:hypothetical protein
MIVDCSTALNIKQQPKGKTQEDLVTKSNEIILN